MLVATIINCYLMVHNFDIFQLITPLLLVFLHFGNDSYNIRIVSLDILQLGLPPLFGIHCLVD